MNQYRCNNGCSHLVNYDFCSVVRDYVREDEESWISKVGCASHSDFQSERDMLLDEFIHKIYVWEKELSMVGNLCNIYGEPKKDDLINGCFIEPWRLDIKMREYIRQQAGEP